MTPKQYATQHRRGQARKELLKSTKVTEAIFNAGYGSLPGYYGTAKATLGMKPAVFRAGGEGEQIRYSTRECSLGTLLVATTGRGICAISLGVEPQPLIDELVQRFPRAVASACAANPLAVAVPCHRVLRQDGSLAGYRWGVERKRQLLGREAQKG